MKVWAAIDLRGGQAVQLVGGDPGEERVRIPDPAAVARRWLETGFRHIHVVDLDAALGDGDNRDGITAIAQAVKGRARLQVGGGVRDEGAVERVLRAGADRAMVGTRAVEDRPWLEGAVERFPDRLVVAADVRDDVVVSRGWTESTDQDAADFLGSLDPLPLAGVLVTDVGREGQQAGIDAQRFRRMAAATRHPVIAAGGVTTPADLAALRRAGIAGAVLGMALYSGRLDPAVALEHEDDQ
ncbi:MAG: 1-(5-phosphoribosyl)-5-[(5-phosphoribosylamino)methylideneamino] imidazole-4-carboxamide isomerase [Gemmatimonadota bacterium]